MMSDANGFAKMDTDQQSDVAQDMQVDVLEEAARDEGTTAKSKSPLFRLGSNPRLSTNGIGKTIFRVVQPALPPKSPQSVRLVNTNANGTLTSTGPTFRWVTPEINMLPRHPVPEIRQIRPRLSAPTQTHGNSTVSGGIALKRSVSTQPVRLINTKDAQQIQVINADGLSPGNFRIVSGSQLGTTSHEGPSKVTIVSALPQSPVNAISLAQAQQMGLVPASGSMGAVKILPKSPVSVHSPQKLSMGNTIRTSDGKTIIIGSPKKQQIIIQPPPNVSSVPISQGQQLIRLPAQVPARSEFQQIASGGKVQYVRVMNAQPSPISSKTQLINLKSGTPILPTTMATGNMVKISLPPPQRSIQTMSGAPPVSGSVKVQRAILPSPNENNLSDNTQTKTLPSSEPMISNAAGLDPKVEVNQENGKPTPIALNNQAFEAFLNKKEEKPKPAQGSNNVFEAPGVRPRKPCNCTKSQCLKLYCDCFANGEFCFNCNCTNCNNNLQHERQRQKSIKQCLDRNPSAFRPKIGKTVFDGERRHNKGCNCKKSGCLKNYCECYEAKIPCTDSCRCIGCKNIEEETEIGSSAVKQERLTPSLPPIAAGAPVNGVQTRKLQNLKSRLGPLAAENSVKTVDGVTQLFSFVTTEVVEATCMCLMERANEAEKEDLTETDIEGMIIEEFGRCLKQIIEMAQKSSTNNSTSVTPPDS